MDDQIDITPLLDTGYVQQQVTEGNNAVFKNGRLVYIILDINKAGKYFYDLRSVFNASTGEGGKNLKIMFMGGVIPYQLNGKSIGIDGKYPSGQKFHVTGAECQANSSLIDFQFPLGLFQEAGIYQFQFEIRDESGNLATSHYCFFQVTQNATTLALDWQNGVNPFDSDYEAWKNQVDQKMKDFQNQIASSTDTLNDIKNMAQAYQSNMQAAADAAAGPAAAKAAKNILASNNEWTGSQTFDDINLSDNITLQNQPLAWPNSFDIAKVTGNSVQGTAVYYMSVAQFLYIFGWIGSPKSTQDTFKAYIPTSITGRIVTPEGSNNRVYYVGVDDGDWVHPSGNTTPVELYLETDNGVLGINGSAQDGGCRINWLLPLSI